MVVSAEEGLRAREDVPNDHCRSEGVDDVLVVGVQQQPVVYVACITQVLPEKPITALMSKSFCI